MARPQAQPPGHAPMRPGFRLSAAQLKALAVRNNSAGLRRAAGHLGTIATVGTLLWLALGTAWALPLVLIQAYAVAFLFNVVHETAHQTAFRSRTLNLGLGHLAGFAVFLPYAYYRAYHWEHHRHTQDPAKDPELANPLPRTRAAIAWAWSGMPIWIGRARLLWQHAVMGRVRVPWVPPEQHGLIVREARLYLLGYGLVLAASVAAGSLAALWLWVLPLMLGQLALRPYLLAEHTGCDHGRDMLSNTRSISTHALVHFYAWNMPFHTAHHAYPAVPFHALPRLHALLAPHIVHQADGYPAATAAVLQHLLAPQASSSPGRDGAA